MVASRIATLRVGDNQHQEGVSIDTASRMVNVGRATTARARTVQQHGIPELGAKVDAGEDPGKRGAQQ